MNNDLISREALRNVILNDRKLDGANANWEVNRILVHIDNAPTVETFTKDDMAGAYNEGYYCGSRESERPKESELVKAYTKGFDTGVETVKSERPQGEWISVSERLPEEHGYYLVTTDGSHNAVIDIAEYGKFFRKPENEYVLVWNKASRVIAWQPLPEPYNEGGEDE